MFVGHYGAALALKGAERRASLGLLAKYGMPVFVVVLLLIKVGNLSGPPPENFTGIFTFAMASYLAFAGLAFWLDRRRS